MTTPVLYPREVICGSCGASMLLTWHNPLELGQGGDPIHKHPNNVCEFAGKMLKPVGMFAGEIPDGDV